MSALLEAVKAVLTGHRPTAWDSDDDAIVQELRAARREAWRQTHALRRIQHVDDLEVDGAPDLRPNPAHSLMHARNGGG